MAKVSQEFNVWASRFHIQTSQYSERPQGFPAVSCPRDTPLVWQSDCFNLWLNWQMHKHTADEAGIVYKVGCAASPAGQRRPWGTCEKSSAPRRPGRRSSAGVHSKLPLPCKRGWSEASEGCCAPSWHASQVLAGCQLPNCTLVGFLLQCECECKKKLSEHVQPFVTVKARGNELPVDCTTEVWPQHCPRDLAAVLDTQATRWKSTLCNTISMLQHETFSASV